MHLIRVSVGDVNPGLEIRGLYIFSFYCQNIYLANVSFFLTEVGQLLTINNVFLLHSDFDRSIRLQTAGVGGCRGNRSLTSNNTRTHNVGLMLGQRRRRSPIIRPALG